MSLQSADVAQTLFLSTIPGATPSKWVHRFTSDGSTRRVQLVNHDESSQTLFLQPGPDGTVRGIPQLGYLRWRRDASWHQLVTAHGLDPDEVHLVSLYEEEPVIVVCLDHLLAAWDPQADGPIPAEELTEGFLDPADFAPPVAPDALEPPEVPGSGERMAIEIVATGTGFTLLPASVARMFGVKRTLTLPTTAHPGWQVGLAWRRDLDSPLIQDFIGVTKGRRPSSQRWT
ncbi:LysR family transcriptional regulator substrate-binding protein [Auritidibacter ignavus]|uniref:LysR family transcriptional regulator substrate-binding protein n=1 Tax=Auritidibacter TaxID=1160973 RepID=UPI000D73E2A7|nr:MULTISPECIES: LysR family transcriptional regulator substrate-binding protein [Auritidibacter]PXA76532.1 hypothetical protein DCC24_07125 [Auritidibacter sp. NML100628]PXA79361.1 hypothetical protein DCC25_09515 [Auritidibacter sp. NML120636]WGH80908.1 LysR family transcriptional regulator substrate-binding protein [Auritidibacter ignavus]WGH90125.1 LysR family transcriptional regulator substrate-binding protein [Auritidibacter ignavus]WHS29205.1 LysR family transcriptional regulator substr